MIHIPPPKLFFVCLDGVQYAATDNSEFMARRQIDDIIATAYFHHMEDSELLRDAHQVAVDILNQLPPEQAAMLRAVPDQKCFGTCKIEDPRAPMVNITFDD